MADATYQPKAYREQGGDRFVVASGGSLDVESGGEIDIEASGELKIAGVAITATAAEINRQLDLSAQLVAAGATKTLTIADSHKLVLLDTAAGSVVTLPAAAGTGAVYRFVVSTTATTNSHVVKVANASDTMVGWAFQISDDGAGEMKGYAASGTDDTITLNRSTTGLAQLGETIEVTDYATNLWAVRVMTSASGTEATPFSATVA